MALFGLFGKSGATRRDKKDEGSLGAQAHGSAAHGEVQKEQSPLVRASEIISGNDPVAVGDIRLLVQDEAAFAAKHREWYEEMTDGIDDAERHERLLNLFAYWLVGYETDATHGAYVDWNEAPEEIAWQLQRAVTKLGYPMDLEAIPFAEDESTDGALAVLGSHVEKHGFELVRLDTGGDCHHLYVIPQSECDELLRIGDAVDFDFTVLH